MMLYFALSFVRDSRNILQGPNEEKWQQNKGDIDSSGYDRERSLSWIKMYLHNTHTQTRTTIWKIKATDGKMKISVHQWTQTWQ